MAHYAKIDENTNKVLQVIVYNNDDEAQAVTELTQMFGHSLWKKTSFNTKKNKHVNGKAPLRGNFAAVGYEYRPDLDAFIPPKPFESWTLNETKCDWEAPKKKPTTGYHRWNEDTQEWREVIINV